LPGRSGAGGTRKSDRRIPRGTGQPDDGRIDLLRSQGSTGTRFVRGLPSSRGTRTSGSKKSGSLRNAANGNFGASPESPGSVMPRAGTLLTYADEPGDELFLILDGTASVEVATEKRGPLRPGEPDRCLRDDCGRARASILIRPPIRSERGPKRPRKDQGGRRSQGRLGIV